MSDDFKVTDRRRITPQGVARRPSPSSRPSFPYRKFKDAMEASWRHVSTHIERDLRNGRLQPEARWTFVWGLALSANQTHNAVALLLAEKNRPKTLPLQASILVRGLLECLGNALALTANANAYRWFAADGYRERVKQQRVARAEFGHNPKWRVWLDQVDAVLVHDARWAKLGVRRRRRPETIPEWPSPYWLSRARSVKGRRRKLPVLLKGNRARLFQDAYKLWYALLSSYAHQRSAAVQYAVFSNYPDAHTEPGGPESDVMSQAMLFYACILSELEHATQMPSAADLRVLWSLLWDVDEHAQRFFKIRYRRLLNMRPFSKTRTSR